ncbi:MAG: alginate export family protein [Cyclobacteriaceae bacterium]|nr:alginate export family protein [Cyclobacteriaceae bacterium]
MDKKIYLPILVLLFSLHNIQNTFAQFSVSGQLRTRTELRNGQGTPQVEDTVRALFTSQRTRLNFGYAAHRFKIYASVQDVRVWGQDASSINRITTDAYDGVMLHEAWGEISLVDTGKVIKNLTLKIGRQELVYDDVRFLGNLDWLQQARRHDAALIKFEHKGWTAHLGVAYNQSAERKSNTIYSGTPVGYPVSTNGMSAMYKSMQFLYVGKKLHFGNASILAFKDDFSKFHYAPTDVNKITPIYDRGVWSRYTIAGNLFGTVYRKFTIALTASYQGGQYREGTNLNEYLVSASALYAVGRKLSVGPGIDMTSGNNGSDPTKKFQRFDPLYGTPHKFWGLMDYFYVADGFGANGLTNYYLKTKYKAKDNLTFSLDAHEFVLPSAVADSEGKLLTKNLGTEFDFVLNYGMTKAINIEVGYSAMLSTETMASAKVKNVKRAADFSDWAYVMISIKPAELVFKN